MAKSCSTTCQSQSEDILKFAKNCKPPPPPDDKDLWELQFCRWWGWNWVQKAEMKQQKMILECNNMIPNNQLKTTENKQICNTCDNAKLKKSHLKDLCDCLCFKKRPKNTPDPKQFYGTPSNSAICLCATLTHSVSSNLDQVRSTRNIEIHQQISKKSVCQPCGPKCSEQSDSSFIEIRKGFSDSDSCKCGSVNCKGSSSTEDSIRYLQVVCNCCKPEKLITKKEQPKNDCQTQTFKASYNQNVAQAQTSNSALRICGTQTVSKERRKKKHITVVCCHCCQCDCCCKNNNCQKNNTDPSPKILRSSVCVAKASKKIRDPGKNIQLFNFSERPSFPNFKGEVKDVPLPSENKFWNRALERYKPWDRLFSHTLYPSKFGSFYAKHPFVSNTKSDILDQRYRVKIDEEFSSPVSGKVYKLSPMKIEELKIESLSNFSNIPDPIEVKEDVEYLRKLEEDLKTELNSRAMLDRICDTILFTSTNDTKHTIVNDFQELCPSDKSIQTCNSNLLHTFAHPSGLVKDESTQSTTNNMFNFEKSLFTHDVCPQTLPSQSKLVENLVPYHNGHFFKRIDSSSSNEEQFQLNMNLFSFSQNTSFHSKSSKRNTPSPCERPKKRIKRASRNESTMDILKNMEYLFKKMNDIIYTNSGKNHKPIEMNTDPSQKSRNEIDTRPSDFKLNDPYNLNAIQEPPVCNTVDVNNSPSGSKCHETLSSESSLFTKIDEIINKSQATENQIQQVVLRLPIRKDDTKRDYANSDLEKYMSPRNSEVSSGLTTILESTDEKSEEICCKGK